MACKRRWCMLQAEKPSLPIRAHYWPIRLFSSSTFTSLLHSARIVGAGFCSWNVVENAIL
jgi:hypothetical protein